MINDKTNDQKDFILKAVRSLLDKSPGCVEVECIVIRDDGISYDLKFPGAPCVEPTTVDPIDYMVHCVECREVFPKSILRDRMCPDCLSPKVKIESPVLCPACQNPTARIGGGVCDDCRSPKVEKSIDLYVDAVRFEAFRSAFDGCFEIRGLNSKGISKFQKLHDQSKTFRFSVSDAPAGDFWATLKIIHIDEIAADAVGGVRTDVKVEIRPHETKGSNDETL